MLNLSRKPVKRETEIDGEVVRFKMHRPDRATAIRIVSGIARVRNEAIPRAAFELKRLQRDNARADCDLLRTRVRELGSDPVEIERGAMEPEDMANALRAWFGVHGHAEPEHPEETSAARMEAMLAAMARFREAEATYVDSIGEDLLQAAFGLVHDVEGVAVDGDFVTKGSELLELPLPQQFISFVVNTANELATLTKTEGKASGSPSTSEPAERTSDGTSAAESAGDGDGTGLATAPETPVVVQ